MTDETILLVEDNPDDEALALRAFRKHAVQQRVDVMRNGQEALDYLMAHTTEHNQGKIAFVLMDINLPLLSGVEVIEKFREARPGSLPPVVMLTSSDEETDLDRSYAAGANSYVRKPVDFQQFAETLKDISHYWLQHNQRPVAECIPAN